MFVLLPLVILAAWRRRALFRESALRFSSLASLQQVRPTARQTLTSLPTLLRAFALVLLVVALARPQMGTERVRDLSRGIAIEMVVDRSSSMGAEMRWHGLRSNRLQVVKRVFEDFVDGSGELPGRPNDLIGMITFARYPDTICPLTLAHGTLGELIRTVKLVDERPEDGTAIGDAVALAAARLRKAEETLERKTGERPDYEIKSKVVILLTDGENNAGERSVAEAAALAKEWDVKVYAISVGEERNMRTMFGVVPIPKQPGIDDQALTGLAESTGGIYRLARDADSLMDVYREIDQLEKSEIEAVRYLDYRELFTPFALSALLLLCIDVALRSTWLRTLP